MRKLAEVIGQEMEWSQPRVMKKEFELRTASDLLATLRFRSGFGTFATAESAEGTWTFKRVGFWRNRVSIRANDSDVDFAEFRNSTWKSGGTLAFESGERFNATTNFWQTNLRFETESGDALVRFKYGGVFRKHAGVEVTTSGQGIAQLPILVTFGWYLAIMLDSDSTTAVAAGAGG